MRDIQLQNLLGGMVVVAILAWHGLAADRSVNYFSGAAAAPRLRHPLPAHRCKASPASTSPASPSRKSAATVWKTGR